MVIGEMVLDSVDQTRGTIQAVTRFLHDHPELAHEEYECFAYLSECLERAGFAVERGVLNLPTAFTARFKGGRPGKTVGVVLEYDAVAMFRPTGLIEAAHGCGHGPMSGGVIGAAIALSALGARLPGSLVVVGCPADEVHSPGTVAGGGGKAITARHGLWDSLDAALYVHPEDESAVYRESFFMARHRAVVSGARSWEDASTAAPFAAAPKLIEVASLGPDGIQLEQLRIEGGVRGGSELYLRADFIIRGRTETNISDAAQFLRNAVPGADWTTVSSVESIRASPMVISAAHRAFATLGIEFNDDPAFLPAMTDFGNIARRVPAGLIGIGRKGGWPFHTDEAAALFTSSAGDDLAFEIARVLALTTLELTGSEG